MKFYLVADRANINFTKFARQVLVGNTIIIPNGVYDVLSMHTSTAKKNQVDAIILSHEKLLQKLLVKEYGIGKAEGTLQEWAGARFVVDGILILIVRPFKQLVTTKTASFLLKWYIRKQFHRDFPAIPELQWRSADSQSQVLPDIYAKFESAIAIAVDIETYRQPISIERLTKAREEGKPVDGLAAFMPLQTASNKNSKTKGWCIPKITMIGYCGLFNVDGKLESFSLVLPIRTFEDIVWMRKFNNLPAPKICQNGGYEATHLIRYNAPLHNWIFDTFHMMHCYYVELPRTLNFISSMFITNYEYWKDESSHNMELYNAKDTHYTLWAFLIMCYSLPEWAKTNYLIEFRKVFPNITCGLEGLLVDKEENQRLREHYTGVYNNALHRLKTILYPSFNPSSPPQVLAIMNALQVAKYKSSDDKHLTKFAESSEFASIIVELIREARGARKKLSTYIDATLFDGRLLYELNAGGTDTGRSASKASNLWVGTQIQNQDNKLRSQYIADEGWVLANCDGSQAESRTTAYISQDLNLINTVETAPDFHTRNASQFFGIPEEQIQKPIRNLSKRVNHGSNYNMKEGKLLETMGSKNVLEAKRLLGLPTSWGLLDVCRYLLNTFEKTYPTLKGEYYDRVIQDIKISNKLVSANGWTRYCFGTPSRMPKDKLDLNAYVAHLPQNLSVMMLDDAMFEFWHTYQIQKNMIRLKAQVHDEILYMVRPEDYQCTKPALSELMRTPIEVHGRTLIIPNDGGSKDRCWGNLKD